MNGLHSATHYGGLIDHVDQVRAPLEQLSRFL